MPLLPALTLSLLTAAPALHVLPVEETGGACPAHAALVDALALSLPGVRVSRTGQVQGEDLLVRVHQSAEGWRLEVTRADGSLLLQRTLAQEGRSCQVLADASVLILERHLQEISWSGRAELLEQLPEPAPASPTAGRPEEPQALPAAEAQGEHVLEEGGLAAAAPTLPAPEGLATAERQSLPPEPVAPEEAQSLPPEVSPSLPPASSARPGVGAQLLLGPGLGLDPSLGASPALLLHARLAPAGPLQLGVLAQAEWPRTQEVVAGARRAELHSQALLGLASVGLCAQRASLSACGVGLAGAWYLRGWASGPLHRQRAQALLLPAAGAAGTLALALGPRWAVEALVGAVAPLGTGALVVEGTEARRDVPRLQALGALGARWTLQ